MTTVRVLLGLGSNQGDRLAHLQRAVARIGQLPGVAVRRVSSWRESELVGDGPPQPPFLNGIAELDATLPAGALLAALQALEIEAGRQRPAQRNHPRPLDLDLLFYGDAAIDSRDLVVPHPRWSERAFVIEPLRELGYDVGALPRVAGMRIVDSPGDLVAAATTWLEGGCLVGLVPTMGSLHAGHASLLRRAREECDRVVATVFVNPLQFGAGEDFAAYPRDLDGDRRLCAAHGVDLLFAPPVESMFPADFCSRIAVGAEAEGLENDVRPGHFAGVATVVARLFALVRPHRAYFGEKDAQQLAVVRRLVVDLGFPLRVVPCPTVRAPDGLALSSRNAYLGAADRAASTVLYRALCSARTLFARGERDRDRLVARARAVLATESRAAVDYVELRREGDLAVLPPGPVAGGRMLVAARFVDGPRPVRLLDNLSLDRPEPE